MGKKRISLLMQSIVRNATPKLNLKYFLEEQISMNDVSGYMMLSEDYDTTWHDGRKVTVSPSGTAGEDSYVFC